jgi:hypothetical protein
MSSLTTQSTIPQIVPTLSGLQRFFDGLYSRRNFFVNGSFDARAMHIQNRIGKVEDAKRKDERLPGRLARIVAYTYGGINYFNGHVNL